MKQLIIKFTAFLLLVLFLIPMVGITIQYFPFSTDVAFLRIKQDYICKPFYIPAFYIHVYTAIFVLFAGFTQFSDYILKNYKAIHKLFGKFYVIVVVMFAAPSGFFIGWYANGGISSQIAFCLLAILWFYFTLSAYFKAARKKINDHKAFMYRSFALALSAITLRAWKYIIIFFFHPHPMDAYKIVAWLGWIPNLLLAEYLIYKHIKDKS